MVTLKRSSRDSLEGSDGATKNYIMAQIDAIPAIIDNITGDGTDGQFVRFTGASTIGDIDSMSVSTNGYSHNKTFIPSIAVQSIVNFSHDVDLDDAPYQPLEPVLIFKIVAGTGHRKFTIDLPSTKAIVGQTFDFVGWTQAAVPGGTVYKAEVVLRTNSGGPSYGTLINGVDHTATDFLVVDAQGNSGTGTVTDMHRMKIINTGLAEIGWLVM